MKENEEIISLLKNKEYQKGIDLFEKIDPVNSGFTINEKINLYHNIGIAYFQFDRFEEARVYYKKALALTPDTQNTNKTDIAVCILDLTVGNFSDAFVKYYLRWLDKESAVGWSPNLPMATKPENILNRRVLVLPEQGFGDEIMTSLCYEWLSNNVEYAFVRVRAPMLNLIKKLYQKKYDNLTFFAEESEFDGKVIPKFDIQVASMEVFGFYYLINKTHPQTKFNFKTKTNKKLKIGIAPYTLPGSENFLKKNINPLVFENHGIDIEIVQTLTPEHPSLPDFLKDTRKIPLGSDFLFTAERLLEYDYLFVTDTAVAHLAGLLGLRAYVIISDYLDWRWEHMNMYPSVKVIQYSDVPKEIEKLKLENEPKHIRGEERIQINKKIDKFIKKNDYKNALKYMLKLDYDHLDNKNKARHLNGLGFLFNKTDNPKAKKYLKKATELDQQHIGNLYTYLLNQGDFKEGFEIYHHRWMTDKNKIEFCDLKVVTKPEQIKNKTVLMISEQGLGDDIMSTLVLEWLSKNTKFVYFQVRGALFELFKELYHYDNIEFILEKTPYIIQECDIQLASMDAFSFYYQMNNKIPEHKGTPKEQKNIKKIGIAFYCSPRSSTALARNYNPGVFKNFNFDYTIVQTIIPGHPSLPRFLENTPRIPEDEDFLYTSKIIKEQDLIITADTAIAHLAGILDIPTYVVINKHRDWRFCQTKMYPSVRTIELKELKPLLKSLSL